MIKIVIVGGGAGGLKLATRLGKHFTLSPVLKRQKKEPQAQVTLVDKNRTHIWKPLLHQVATGALNSGLDALEYQVHGRANGFQFELGSLSRLDRKNQRIELAEVRNRSGNLLVPERTLEYDYLVVALGSESNDFNIPGIREYCQFLDSSAQAQKFHQHLLDKFLQLETKVKDKVQIAIVGGGATGVELAAELVDANRQMGYYGHIANGAIELTLIEASKRLLPVLPSRLGTNAERELSRLGVRVLTNCQIGKATDNGFITTTGETIPASIRVWAAGIKASKLLCQLDGLETNKLNQITVQNTLQSKIDPRIFALGDCAGCIDRAGNRVPPRAQAAQQMAETVYHNLMALIEGGEQQEYLYRDRGSLVSLSHSAAIGNLMGSLVKGSLIIEGRFAGFAYRSLYRMHLAALHGWPKATLLYLIGNANRFVKPRLKLH